MYSTRRNYQTVCRWCGRPYTAKFPVTKPGFCRNACKQAHYRAYKKYVTARRAAASSQVKSPVTLKKPKKHKSRKGK